MADRKLGCLTIFLFVALCASVFFNFVLALMAFRGFASGVHPDWAALTPLQTSTTTKILQEQT